MDRCKSKRVGDIVLCKRTPKPILACSARDLQPTAEFKQKVCNTRECLSPAYTVEMLDEDGPVPDGSRYEKRHQSGRVACSCDHTPRGRLRNGKFRQADECFSKPVIRMAEQEQVPAQRKIENLAIPLGNTAVETPPSR